MPIKMKQMPETERPYEKLEQYGEKALSNAELLAIIIKTGTKEEIQEFMKIKGIGKVKAIQLKAVCELATRMNTITNYKQIQILKPQDIAEILIEKLRFEKQEILEVVILDNKNKILRIKEVAKGGGNFVTATIKSVLAEAVKVEANKIILIHNHPSGDPTPSKHDIDFTEKVQQATRILGIQLLDHIVIGKTSYVSIFSQIPRFIENLD